MAEAAGYSGFPFLSLTPGPSPFSSTKIMCRGISGSKLNLVKFVVAYANFVSLSKGIINVVRR